MMRRPPSWPLVIGLFLSACAHGTPPSTPLPQMPAPGAPVALEQVQSILEQRCIVCHGCYDAPCQLLAVVERRHRARRQQGSRLSHRSTDRDGADASVHRRARHGRVARARLLFRQRRSRRAWLRVAAVFDARARSHTCLRTGREAAGIRASRHQSRAVLPDGCRISDVRRRPSARRHALRHGAARREGILDAGRMGGTRRAGAVSRAPVTRHGDRTGRKLGDVPERRLAQAAAHRALSVRALVSRAPRLRGTAGRDRSSASFVPRPLRALRSTRSPRDAPTMRRASRASGIASCRSRRRSCTKRTSSIR